MQLTKYLGDFSVNILTSSYTLIAAIYKTYTVHQWDLQKKIQAQHKSTHIKEQNRNKKAIHIDPKIK